MSRRAKLAVGRHIAPVRFLLFAAVFAGVAGALAALGDGSRTALLMGFDAAALVGMAGVYMGLVVRHFGAAPLIPVKDPFLPDSLEYDNG